MALTQTDMDNMIWNPVYAQKVIIDSIEKGQGVEIGSETSPFLSLMEASIMLSHSGVTEGQNLIRTLFPTLATTKDDLYIHLTDNELSGLISTPASTYLIVEVNVNDIKNSGYKPDGSNYRETMLPIGTTISVSNYTLTLLNDILIRLYDKTEVPYVESISNSNDVAINNVTILESEIINNSLSVPYIRFKLPINQVTKQVISKSVQRSIDFEYTHQLTDKFYHAEVYYKNQSDGNNIKIEQSYSDTYLSPTTPKVFVKIGEGTVSFKIPRIYVMNGSISGNITIIVYETKGKTNMPIYPYTRDKFSMTLGDTNTARAATAQNIQFAFSSDTSIDGGTNGLSTDELKESIINNTLGVNEIPITNYQIEKIGQNNNFDVSLVEDVITNRTYIASKNIEIESSVIKALPDIFNNTLKLELPEYISAYPELVRDTDFVIKSGSIFKENNGVISILNKGDISILTSMNILNKIEHLKTNKYFFNPFTYVVSKADGVSDCRIYHLDNPVLDNVRNIDKNQNVTDVNANMVKYDISLTDEGYRLLIRMSGDNGFSGISTDMKKVQASILLSSNEYVHYQLEYDANNDMFYTYIKIDEMVNEEDRITISNGISDISTKLCDLITDIYIYCYITEPTYLDAFGYLRDEIVSEENNITVLTKDKIRLTFGKRIDYLWNKVYSTYTDRKYKTYQEDVYDVYETDVYETDIDGKLLWKVASNNKIECKILHRKGDYRLDEDNNKIIKHKKGDTILDVNGEPIIDVIPGICRYIDILMLEYEFLEATGDINKNLNRMITANFETMLFDQLPDMNKSLLERTNLYYRPYKSSKPIEIMVNGSKEISEYRVSPKVSLYLDNTNIDLNTQETYRSTIGKIINSELSNSTISLNSIKQKIIDTLDISISGVKIEGLSNSDSEIITLVTNDNKLTLDKVLVYTEYKEVIVDYNLTLELFKTK